MAPTLLMSSYINCNNKEDLLFVLFTRSSTGDLKEKKDDVTVGGRNKINYRQRGSSWQANKHSARTKIRFIAVFTTAGH
jgi:hypothetical protein